MRLFELINKLAQIQAMQGPDVEIKVETSVYAAETCWSETTDVSFHEGEGAILIS